MERASSITNSFFWHLQAAGSTCGYSEVNCIYHYSLHIHLMKIGYSLDHGFAIGIFMMLGFISHLCSFLFGLVICS